MANLSNRKKHQQFGLKLLMIALIVGFTFTIWYVSEKQDRQEENKIPLNSEQAETIKIPADDIRDMRDIYLTFAKKILVENYSNVSLSDSFKLNNLLDSKKWEGVKSLDGLNENEFWNKFKEINGPINIDSAQYKVFGNQVTINFSTGQGDSDSKHNYIRKLSFGNYDNKNRTNITPTLLQDVIMFNDAGNVGGSVTIGSNFEIQSTFEAVKNGKIETMSFSNNSKKWKLLFFFPAAFTFVCPTECLGLLSNFDILEKSNVEIYAISGDLSPTLQAWNKVYFNGLPYSLVSDPDLRLAKYFGFADLDKEDVALRGTVILDPENKIRFMSVQDNDVGRSVDEIVRIIKALQTPGLKPVNWHEGDSVITPAKN